MTFESGKIDEAGAGEKLGAARSLAGLLAAGLPRLDPLHGRPHFEVLASKLRIGMDDSAARRRPTASDRGFRGSSEATFLAAQLPATAFRLGSLLALIATSTAATTATTATEIWSTAAHARWTTGPLFGLVDTQRSAFELVTVELLDSLGDFIRLGEFDESESSRTACGSVRRHEDIDDIADLREENLEIGLRRVVTDIPNENLRSDGVLLPVPGEAKLP